MSSVWGWLGLAYPKFVGLTICLRGLYIILFLVMWVSFGAFPTTHLCSKPNLNLWILPVMDELYAYSDCLFTMFIYISLECPKNSMIQKTRSTQLSYEVI